MRQDLKVLIVEDDPNVLLGCEQALQLEGIPTEGVSTAEKAHRLVSANFPGVVVSDIRLPGMDGMALLDALQAADAELPVVLITGHGDIALAVQAMKSGAQDFIEKPFSPDYLVEVVRRALEKRKLVLEVRELREKLGSRPGIEARILGDSPAIEKARRLIVDLASSAADVLILGETGVGKELAARTCTTPAPGAAAISSPSTAAACRKPCSKARSSGTRPAPLPGRASGASARSSMPRAARCSSTTPRACRCPCRSRCCACCRSVRWSGWGPTRRSPSIAG